MLSALFNGLTISSLFSASLLVIFFISTPRGEKKQNSIFASLVFIFGVQIIYAYCVSNFAYRAYLTLHKPLFMLRQTSLLAGPLFHFYLKFHLNEEARFRAVDLAHLAPFAISIAYFSFYYADLRGFVIWDTRINLYDTVFILAHAFAYIAVSLAGLIAARSAGASKPRRKSDQPGFSWSIGLFVGFIAFWLANLNAFVLYRIVKKPSWCAYTASIFALVVFLAFAVMQFALLLRPGLYHKASKYRSSRLDELSKRESLLRLDAYMRERKPYLDPDLTFDEIAEARSLSRRDLSQIINELAGRGVKSYLNDYRLSESLRLMDADKTGKKTILDILFEAGFNSKSVFNLEFKKRTGITPQEYRNGILRKNADS